MIAVSVSALAWPALAPAQSNQPAEGAPKREIPSWGRAPAPRAPSDKSEKSDKAVPSAPGEAGPGADADKHDRAASGQPPGGAAKEPWQQTEVPDTPAQRRRMLDDLYAHLATIDAADEARPLVTAIERLWLFTGSDTIDVLMERVLKAVAEQRLDLAEQLSDAIVELAPGYAEGWNRRALVAYLRNDATGALHALRRALVLEPNHFKALDGLAQVMRETGERKAALQAYRKLLEVHPYWDGAGEAIEALEREVEGQGI